MPEWIVQAGLTLLLGAIAWYLKRHVAQQDKSNEQQQERIDVLARDLQQYKLDVAERYVHKDEFIRAMSNTDRKLDNIHAEILKLTASINGGNGGK